MARLRGASLKDSAGNSFFRYDDIVLGILNWLCSDETNILVDDAVSPSDVHVGTCECPSSYKQFLGLPQHIWSMNIQELNPGAFVTLSLYAAIVIPLTIVTVWAIGALQFKPGAEIGGSTLTFNDESDRDMAKAEHLEFSARSILERLGWPVIVVHDLMRKRMRREEKLIFDA